MTRTFLDRPTGRLIFINSCIGLGLLVAYRNGYRGLDLLYLSIILVVLLNAAGVVGLWIFRKSTPVPPNKFLLPLWIAIGIHGLIYLWYHLFPAK